MAILMYKTLGLFNTSKHLTYTSEQLPGDCPELLRIRVQEKAKKRGSDRDARERLGRRSKTFILPTIALSNVQSLNNKMNELTNKHNDEFRKSNLICCSETWMKDPNNITLGGYTMIREDRNEIKPEKSFGGGLCIFVDEKLASHFRTRDIELQCPLDPFIFLKEFSQLTIILVYVPRQDNERPVFILGDFNACNLKTHLPHQQRYVGCPACLIQTLDPCYRNITDAYKAVWQPPLG